MKDINPVIAGVLRSHLPALAQQPKSTSDAAEHGRPGRGIEHWRPGRGIEHGQALCRNGLRNSG